MGEPIRFAVMGQEYVISGNIEPGYIAELADYVDKNMKELYARSGGISSERLAVLTAMNIADELFTIRRRLDEAKTLAGQKVDLLISNVRGDLDGDEDV